MFDTESMVADPHDLNKLTPSATGLDTSTKRLGMTQHHAD
jgi:hypothetical protein